MGALHRDAGNGEDKVGDDDEDEGSTGGNSR